MYPIQGKVKHRFKEKLLAFLYLAFLLAETGEFFVSINHPKIDFYHPQVQERDLEIPEHLPEDSKIEFIRMIKIYLKNKET